MTTFMISRRTMVLGLASTALLPGIDMLPADGSAGALAAEPKSGGTLKISHSTRIATLNVMTLSGPAEYPVIDMIYSGLTRMGPDNQPKPDLAERWEASDDAKTFTFFLRPGVTFHDGASCTADDVVATFMAILDTNRPAAARSVLNMIDTVEAVDPTTVKFSLKVPFADLPISTAHANARILSKAAIDGPKEKLDTTANGTGPFMLETYDSARMVRLVKNPKYYIAGKPYLDAIEMHLFPDLAAESANFLSGAMDVMLTVQQADFDRISKATGITAKRVPSGRFVNVTMRQDQKPFDDVRVRKALAMAVDRPMLVDLVLEGLGRPAYDNLISPEFPYAIKTPEIAYDPAAAKQLLAEAGYPDGIKITLVASNRPAIRGQVAIALKQMALPAGFDITVESMPHDTYLANVWMKGQFYMGYWGMQPTEDATFNLLLTSNASYEDTAWKNETFDKLIADARATTDTAKRAELYAKAQELQLAETPYIVPIFEDVLTASGKDAQDWTVAPLSRYFYAENVWLNRA
ncbi:ABC transporter substrate-binding protein [Rhizobium sp. SSA_523]|uniref:ABC transporter substrate-binding protein n=1 Tax=Rhizobium sp. SSA_523 TaxID=2952477 RepID=UPI002090DF59|nr:ABC transporter substrate-binding protein [Rhizobium sp. SSA_523]MCO5731183.1 ABC transporter substrate-binding protein [Rhizobium sp. SSA_523]WKC22273.1 ABC transporter substrate-binding protein [Rhizobium sp. SSA_523]